MEQSVYVMCAEVAIPYKKTSSEILKGSNVIVLSVIENYKDLMCQFAKTLPHILIIDLEIALTQSNKIFNSIKQHFPAVKIIIVSQYRESILMENYIQRGTSA